MDVEPNVMQVLAQIQTDLRSLLPLPAEVKELRREMREFETRVSVRLASLEVKVATETATKKDLAELRADGERMLVTALDAQEKARAAADKALSHPDILNDHGARLRDHERRLRRLEGRKPS